MEASVCSGRISGNAHHPAHRVFPSGSMMHFSWNHIRPFQVLISSILSDLVWQTPWISYWDDFGRRWYTEAGTISHYDEESYHCHLHVPCICILFCRYGNLASQRVKGPFLSSSHCFQESLSNHKGCLPHQQKEKFCCYGWQFSKVPTNSNYLPIWVVFKDFVASFHWWIMRTNFNHWLSTHWWIMRTNFNHWLSTI